MLRKLGVLVTSLALVLVSSLALVVVSATQASADDFLRLDLTSQGEGGDGDPSGPYRRYVPRSPTPLSMNYTLNPENDYGVCPPKVDGRGATAYTRMYRRATPTEMKDPVFRPDFVMFGTYYFDLGEVCHYPARDAVTDVNCAWDVKITTTGPMSAPKTYGPTTRRSAWSRTSASRKNPSLCVSSVNAVTNHQMREFGRYRVDGLVGLRPCKRVDYGGGQPSVIANCGDPNYVPHTIKAQRWCGGADKGWGVSRLFTVDECRGPAPKTWACKISSVSPLEVLDDGIVRTPKWTKFGVVGGVKKLTNYRTLMKVAKDSTPSRGEGVAQDAKTQSYQAPAATWIKGLIYQTPLRWWAPSSTSQPWTMDRWVKFDALFKVSTVKITTVNVLTDEPSFSESTTWKAETGTCPSVPLVVTVSRARNTR